MSDKKTQNPIPIFTGALSILLILALILPHLIPSYKCASPCSRVESDANNIAAAIAGYFSIPGRTHIEANDLDGGFTSKNPWTLIQCGGKIYIYVYDQSKSCAIEYQDQFPEWNSNIYTKIVE